LTSAAKWEDNQDKFIYRGNGFKRDPSGGENRAYKAKARIEKKRKKKRGGVLW